MQPNEVVGVFTSISSSYYGIILSFCVAVFGAAAYMFHLHLEKLKSKSELILPFVIFILITLATVCGLLLFKELQEIVLTCKPAACGMDGCDLKFESQKNLLNAQVLLLSIGIILLGVYTYKVKKKE